MLAVVVVVVALQICCFSITEQKSCSTLNEEEEKEEEDQIIIIYMIHSFIQPQSACLFVRSFARSLVELEPSMLASHHSFY